MNFDLTEDQEMLKALAERFVADNCDLDRRRAALAADHGFLTANWTLLGELGLIAAPFAEADGGMALDATALVTVFEALGRGLAVEPLIENVLVAGCLFAETASGSLSAAWLPDLVAGARRIALAHAEARARGGRLWVESRAIADGDGLRLDGAKAYVPAGQGVDGYIVSARTAGAPGEAQGLALVFVPADAPGLSAKPWRMADGARAVSLTFEGLHVPASHRLSGGADRIAQVQTRANLARAGESLGIMERIFAETLDYLRTRRQFGAPLGSFQAIQHRMALQYAAIEQSRGLLNLAQVRDDGVEGDPDFAQAVAGARAFISRASIALGHEMIQFHGGMGVTDELPIGHAHKRLLVLSRWPDDPDVALDRFAGIEC